MQVDGNRLRDVKWLRMGLCDDSDEPYVSITTSATYILSCARKFVI